MARAGFLIFLGCVPTLGFSQSVTVDVSRDSWIQAGVAGTPRGGADGLSICPRADYWIYLQFDLREIDGAIHAAELQMTRFSGSRP